VGQDAAAQVGAKVLLHPSGHAEPAPIRFFRMREEALEMVLDDGVERRAGRLAPPVDGSEDQLRCVVAGGSMLQVDDKVGRESRESDQREVGRPTRWQ
jgi:hypothetical protein